jgi:hypothetical protein
MSRSLDTPALGCDSAVLQAVYSVSEEHTGSMCVMFRNAHIASIFRVKHICSEDDCMFLRNVGNYLHPHSSTGGSKGVTKVSAS